MAAKSGGGGAGVASSCSSKTSASSSALALTGTDSEMGRWTPTWSPRRTRWPPKIRGSTELIGRSRSEERSRLDKDVLATTLHHDLLGVLEPSHDIDDSLLGL